MKYIESSTIELKREFVDDIKKTVVAFANTSGGTLYVGVADDGSVCGVANASEVVLQINNMIRDSVKPDLTMFMQCEEQQIEGKSIVVVTVTRGTYCPYYIAAKGLRPEGVFIQRGAASVPATDTAIRNMIKESDGESYEELRALNQDLTFNTATNEFKLRQVDFDLTQMKTLKLLGIDSIYNNLGLLLSDQCSHTIKIAVFQDVSMKEFKDRREFKGSLFKQLNDAYAFIDLHNPIKSTFDNLLRIDTRSFPTQAIREALLNAIVHREYAMSGSILIKMFSDRIEFISVGGLLRGIVVADIMSGFSICRNQNLAAVFYRLQLIEAYGTGMQKIFEAYTNRSIKPVVEVTPNVFKVVLPSVFDDGKDITAALASDENYITRKNLQEHMNVSQTKAGLILKHLVSQGVLVKEGNGKNTRYRSVTAIRNQ